MTIEELLSKFGNWVLAGIGAAFAYVAWREKTVSKVASLSNELARLENKIIDLEHNLDTRRAQDISIVTALAEIKAQLAGVVSSVAEIKTELRHKVDRNDHTR